jgi:glycosyltransferase involved in cell wall biosynthesis
VQIAISRGLADYLADTEGFDRAAFRVVHYGIEPGPEPPPPPREPRLVFVGRLIPIKGLDVLMRAFAQARDVVPELTLEVAGAGPLEAELHATAPDGVTFLGRVSPVAPLYERNAIVVVPSRGEGFGMVALEAAERGRAAIVSDAGGLPEIVADGETGVVVPRNDADALARAIVELAHDPDRVAALGAAARQRAVSEFSAEATADRLLEIYRSTAAAASSTSRKS